MQGGLLVYPRTGRIRPLESRGAATTGGGQWKGHRGAVGGHRRVTGLKAGVRRPGNLLARSTTILGC
jgi:hypothetical protein